MDALYRARLLRYFSGCAWYSQLTEEQTKLIEMADWIRFDAIPDVLQLKLLRVIDIRIGCKSYTFEIVKEQNEYKIKLECKSKELTHTLLK